MVLFNSHHTKNSVKSLLTSSLKKAECILEVLIQCWYLSVIAVNVLWNGSISIYNYIPISCIVPYRGPIRKLENLLVRIYRSK